MLCWSPDLSRGFFAHQPRSTFCAKENRLHVRSGRKRTSRLDRLMSALPLNTGHCCLRLRCSKSAKSGGRRLIRSPHGTPGVTESTAIASRPGRTRRLICPTGCQVDCVSSPVCKNIPLSPSGKSSLQARPVPSHRGATRDRHGRGAGCGGRGCALDEWR
jgi:hypothetical protein